MLRYLIVFTIILILIFSISKWTSNQQVFEKLNLTKNQSEKIDNFSVFHTINFSINIPNYLSINSRFKDSSIVFTDEELKLHFEIIELNLNQFEKTKWATENQSNKFSKLFFVHDYFSVNVQKDMESNGDTQLSDILINSKKAIQTQTSVKINEIEYEILLITIQNKNNFYFLNSKIPSQLFDRYSPDFIKMVNSFNVN